MLLGMSIVSTIPDSVRPSPADVVDWRTAMQRAIRDPAELLRVLELPDHFLESATAAARQFGLFAPREYLARITPGDAADPLLKQVLPLADELQPAPGFSADPVGDISSQRSPGLLQKYHGRVLLVVTGVCPVHCRYCFRRHFPYGDGPKNVGQLEPALREIAGDHSVEEVILSGGDPLTISDAQLRTLIHQLAEIPHIHRLRVHTRMPIMIPQRVTDGLLALLRETRLMPVMVVHANHPREIDQAVAASLRAVADAGISLLNQSVLLRGVNDDAFALIELSQRLMEARTLPYYLHQLDRVAGAAHFEVSAAVGLEIVQEMRRQLPGYLVPRYVQEIAGEPGKSPLA